MFDPKYHREMNIWREKIALQADNKPFDRKIVEEKVDKESK